MDTYFNNESLQDIINRDIANFKEWKKKHPGLTIPAEKDDPGNYPSRKWFAKDILPVGSVVKLSGEPDDTLEFVLSAVGLLANSNLHTTICDFTSISGEAVRTIEKEYGSLVTVYQSSMGIYEILSLASTEGSSLLVINPAKYIFDWRAPELKDDLLLSLEKFAESSNMTILLVVHNYETSIRCHHELNIVDKIKGRGTINVESDYCLNGTRVFGKVTDLLSG